MTSGLPDCDKVFMTFFDRWYDPEDRERKGFPATRPDAMTVPEFVGLSPQQASPLTEDGQKEIKEMVDDMIEAAKEDWPSFLPVSEPIDINWVDKFDLFYGEGGVLELLENSDPEDFSNDFLIMVCEFGAVLGHVLISMQPNLHWVYDWPYWESSVMDPETGNIIPVFHWAIKKFSSYGIDDGYKAKLMVCSKMIEEARSGQQPDAEMMEDL
jgi:hypothetical protein